MLKGIHPLLNADLLHLLASMGHGDDLAIVDANHPASAVAAETSSGTLIRLPGLKMEDVARAILTVFPLDEYVDDPVRRMAMVEAPESVAPVQEAVQIEIDRASNSPVPLVAVERYAFYKAARAGFGVIQVGDPRPYGCFLFRKGVVRPE